MKSVYIKIMIVIICIIINILYTNAQTDNSIKINDLMAPNSPAFSILGLNPTDINSPANVQELVLNLKPLLITGSSNNSIPIALEFNPFWLIDHPNLTYDDYIKGKYQSNFWEVSNISIAKSQGSIRLEPNTFNFDRYSIGFRTTFLQGDTKQMVQEAQEDRLRNRYISQLIQKLLNSQIEQQKIVLDSLKQFINKCPSQDNFYVWNELKDSINSINRPVDLLMNINLNNIFDKYLNSEAVTKWVKIFQDMDLNRVGFILEFAGAVVYDQYKDIPNQNSRFTNYGLWLTGTYKTENGFESNIMTRFLRKYELIDNSSNIDIGGKLSYSFKKFSLFIEGIYRSQKILTPKDSNGSEFKYSLDLNYKARKDLVISLSFTNNSFDKLLFNGKNILSLDLNYALNLAETLYSSR